MSKALHICLTFIYKRELGPKWYCIFHNPGNKSAFNPIGFKSGFKSTGFNPGGACKSIYASFYGLILKNSLWVNNRLCLCFKTCNEAFQKFDWAFKTLDWAFEDSRKKQMKRLMLSQSVVSCDTQMVSILHWLIYSLDPGKHSTLTQRWNILKTEYTEKTSRRCSTRYTLWFNDNLSTLIHRLNSRLKQRWSWVEPKNSFALISWCLKK